VTDPTDVGLEPADVGVANSPARGDHKHTVTTAVRARLNLVLLV